MKPPKMTIPKTFSPGLENVIKKLNSTKDLWEVDKLCGLVEMSSHHNNSYPDQSCSLSSNDEYNYLYRTLIPNWINENWAKGMQYDEQDIFRYLYEEHETEFRKYLHLLGYEAQECFVSYLQCSNGPREDDEKEYADGGFIMGFDIFGKEDTEDKDGNIVPGHLPGWAVFQWDYNTCGGGMNLKGYSNYKPNKYGSYNFRSDDCGTNAKCTVCLEGKMFYDFKITGSYGSSGDGLPLWDYLSDGGFTLRMD